MARTGDVAVGSTTASRAGSKCEKLQLGRRSSVMQVMENVINRHGKRGLALVIHRPLPTPHSGMIHPLLVQRFPAPVGDSTGRLPNSPKVVNRAHKIAHSKNMLQLIGVASLKAVAD